jgi:hypothetical protein
MKITKVLCAGLLSAVSGVGLACDLPPLVAVPAKEDVGDKAALVSAEVTAYVEAMRTYTTCVQAELAAAGGDSAPTIIKAVLVQRNNQAVAEVDAVLKQYNESIGAAAGAAAPPPAAPSPREESRRRGSRNE